MVTFTSDQMTRRDQNQPSGRMNRHANWWFQLLSLPCHAVLAWYMRTLDARVVLYDPTVDPAYGGTNSKRRIYTFWHEAILSPLSFRGHCGVTMLLSRHADAEYLSLCARHLGFQMIRGSTNHGGTQALREMLHAGKNSHLGFAVDGPRGPRYHFAAGTVFLASRSGMPIVPMGWAYQRPWRLQKAWDRFAIPRPFGRLRGVLGPAIYVPRHADRNLLEHFCVRIETLQRQLTVLAENWAQSNDRYENEYTLGVGPESVPRNLSLFAERTEAKE